MKGVAAMLHLSSFLGSVLLLAGSIGQLATLLLRDHRAILHALRLMPSVSPLPAPLPPRVRMVPPRRVAMRHAAALREAA